MTEMKVNNLSVDLLQGQANITLQKQPSMPPQPGRPLFTQVGVNVPVSAAGNQQESELKRAAVKAAIDALREAIQTLETFA